MGVRISRRFPGGIFQPIVESSYRKYPACGRQGKGAIPHEERKRVAHLPVLGREPVGG